MSGLSWNCRGLRNVRATGDLVKSHKPDVLFLAETLGINNKLKKFLPNSSSIIIIFLP